ncbi:hypothetical protein TNCV_3983601 [Trichonephila clavipes]|nr:hypothetical protein TNCV_3983601 [Trichonephila clavipes]
MGAMKSHRIEGADAHNICPPVAMALLLGGHSTEVKNDKIVANSPRNALLLIELSLIHSVLCLAAFIRVTKQWSVTAHKVAIRSETKNLQQLKKCNEWVQEPLMVKNDPKLIDFSSSIRDSNVLFASLSSFEISLSPQSVLFINCKISSCVRNLLLDT